MPAFNALQFARPQAEASLAAPKYTVCTQYYFHRELVRGTEIYCVYTVLFSSRTVPRVADERVRTRRRNGMSST